MLERSKIMAGFQGVIVAIACIASFSVLISLMSLTRPTDIGPGGVTLWFVLAFVALTSLFMLIYLARIRRKSGVEAKGLLVRSFRMAVVPAGALIVLLAMSSLGTLGGSDILLVAGAAAIIEFYLYSSDKRLA